MFTATAEMSGRLNVTKSREKSIWPWKLKQLCLYGWRELPLALLVRSLPILRKAIPGLTLAHSELFVKVRRTDGSIENYRRVGRHLITTAGKNAVASAFNNVMELETFKYHGFGTGTTAANIADITLEIEATTAYATDNTRPTGSQANATNTYTTVATITPDAAMSVTEWGLFTQAANSGGTLLDRQVFSVINLNGSGDSLQTTYVLTIS